MGKKVFCVSLGCPKNRVDSEVMVGKLVADDFELVQEPNDADVIVVNTCGFLQSATQESIDTVLEMSGYKERGQCEKLVVTGCMVQRYGKSLEGELPEVDHFLGTGEYHRIDEVLKQEQAPRSFVDTPMYIHDEMAPRVNSFRPHSAYLKISEGCDHRCTFCIIPQLRGKLRSRTIASLVSEAKSLAESGVVELNIVSQDSTAYGRDLNDGSDLGALLSDLAKVDGIAWIRLHYAYPIGLPDSLLRVLSDEPRVVPYLDMPLQHSSGRILKAMRRGVTREGQERILDRVRAAVPDITIRTTFIVGFPGETEEDFADLVDFVRAQRFERVGVFAYSPEDGTPAGDMPDQVPEEVRLARQETLMKVQAEVSAEKMSGLVGQVLPILVDGVSEEHEWVKVGRLATQAPGVDGVVYLEEAGDDVLAGQMRMVEIQRSSVYDVVGRIVSSEVSP